jgi:thioredoxin-related protein
VRATPVIMFFDLDGKPVARYTGATADVDEFMWLGQYVADGIYKDMPFTRYKRERRQSSR